MPQGEGRDHMNDITRELLKTVTGFEGVFDGAYSIREDGGCAGRKSTENVQIEGKQGAPGLVIRVKPGTPGENVYIPACVTRAGVDDLVYNDFIIGEGAKVTIIAGCGVHSDGEEQARHNGIHRFFLGKGASVRYEEKHVAQGAGSGDKRIDPVTDIFLEEDAVLEIDTLQLGGVTHSDRKTRAELGARSKLIIKERILTDGNERAVTDFAVNMNGDDAKVDLISRSVARGDSVQEYHSRIAGNCPCTGHSECDAILAENGRVNAAPELYAGHMDAALIHEAAIGKIAGEQILKLRTLGLSEEEAEQCIIQGFLRG